VTTAAQLLAIDDDVALVESLARLLPAGEAGLAEARHMVDVLTQLQLYLSTSGIWQVLDVAELMDQWGHVEAWLATLGAHEAAELAGAVASLFPGGRVPEREEERFARIGAVTENAQHGRPFDDPWRGISVVRRLDFEYAGAVADVARAVRRLLEANPDDPASALARVAAMAEQFVPPARPTEWAAYVDSGLDGAAQQGAWQARMRSAVDAVTSPAEPEVDAEADARMFRFLDDIARLSADDWSRVAGRRLALSAERKAEEIAFAVVRTRWPRPLGDAAVAQLREAGAADPVMRAAQVTRELPRIGLVGERRGPLEHFAIRAAIQGMDAVRWLDILSRDAEGRRVLHVMLSPFDGYISVEIPRL